MLFFALSPLLAEYGGFVWELWQFAIIANIIFPLILWRASKEMLKGRLSENKAVKARPRKYVKVPGLDLGFSVKILSILLGFAVALPGIFCFREYYPVSSYGGAYFFNGLFCALFLLWGAAIAIASYTYLSARKITHRHHLSYHVYAPVLGVVVGIVASVSVLLTMVYYFIISGAAGASVGAPGGIFASLFQVSLHQAGLSAFSPMAVELIYGVFLIQSVIIISSFISRLNYGHNSVVEYLLISKNLFLAVLSYSVIFFVIPSLFSPIIWSLGFA
jgi:hypothetical protein